MKTMLPVKVRQRAGFSMIGILIVLIIIFILAGYYFGGNVLDQKKQEIGTYQYATGRAKSVAEDVNLKVLQTTIDMWELNHPNERCTLEKLQADGRTIPSPPPGHKWEIDEDNQAILVKIDTGK